MKGEERMGSPITYSVMTKVGSRIGVLGGRDRLCPPQLHNEGFTPSSPQTLKAEHPTRILTMDTAYSHLFQELPRASSQLQSVGTG